MPARFLLELKSRMFCREAGTEPCLHPAKDIGYLIVPAHGKQAHSEASLIAGIAIDIDRAVPGDLANAYRNLTGIDVVRALDMALRHALFDVPHIEQEEILLSLLLK